MILTTWEEEDDGSYLESIARLFSSESTPVLKIRLVKDSEGTYQGIIRDFLSGKMIVATPGKLSRFGAEKLAVEFAKWVIKETVI